MADGDIIHFPEKVSLLNERQVLVLCMKTDTKEAAQIRREMVEILMAWRRGKLAPHSAAPIMTKMFDDCLWKGLDPK
jgi:hypothetical protein